MISKKISFQPKNNNNNNLLKSKIGIEMAWNFFLVLHSFVFCDLSENAVKIEFKTKEKKKKRKSFVGCKNKKKKRMKKKL